MLRPPAGAQCDHNSGQMCGGLDIRLEQLRTLAHSPVLISSHFISIQTHTIPYQIRGFRISPEIPEKTIGCFECFEFFLAKINYKKK